jgi:hypothetical protein
VIPLVFVALLAAACSSHTPSKSAAASAARSSSASSSSASTSASAPATTSSSAPSLPPTPAAISTRPVPGAPPVTAAPAPGARTTVTAIRIEPQDDVDRIVFELGGTGTPGYTVRYVTNPRSAASGRPVSVNGEGVLQVSITGTGLPSETGVRQYSGPDHLATANTQAITEVVWDGQFEGTTTAFIGTQASAQAFHAYLLTNPTRVVVDVAYPQ